MHIRVGHNRLGSEQTVSQITAKKFSRIDEEPFVTFKIRYQPEGESAIGLFLRFSRGVGSSFGY